MAQRSLPQAGNAVGDSGPYTGDEWAEYFQAVFTGDQQATQGPIRYFLNELEVTEAALAVTTDTGAGFVYGHWLINDAAVVINIALAAGGLERYDRVVMVQNNTAAAYNTNLALPAAYAAGVPRNSARIAILQGAEAGAAVLPPLLTGPNYYMVELARYFVNDAAVGTVTDYRDFCMATGITSREVFVTPYISWNASLSTSPLEGISQSWGLQMPDGATCMAVGTWIIPSNWDELPITATAVVFPWVGGNIYARHWAYIGACAEAPYTHQIEPASVATAVTALVNNCIQPTTLTAVTYNVGDIVIFEYMRQATDVLDTVNALVNFPGWIIEYGVR